MATMLTMNGQETVRLYGWVEEWKEAESPVRALLFGELARRAVPVVRTYLSDLYHDTEWIRENVTGPTEFLYMVRYNGTHIGSIAEAAERQASTEPRVLYHVALTVERGMWRVTFTELVRVDNPNY